MDRLLSFDNSELSQINAMTMLLSQVGEGFTVNLKGIIGVDKDIVVTPAGREFAALDSKNELCGTALWIPRNERINLFFSEYFINSLLTALLGSGNNAGFTPAEIAFLDYLMIKILFCLRGVHPFNEIRWDGLGLNKISPDKPCAVLSIKFDDETGFVRIDMPGAFIQEILNCNISRENRALDDAEVWLVFVIAEAEILAGKMNDLLPGSIILFPVPYIKIDDGKIGGAVMLRSENGDDIGGFDIDTGEFIVDPGNKAGAPAGGEKSADIVDSIPITLTVELSRMKMRLSELKRLVPGILLSLKKKPVEDVLIAANGKIIGRGRLINLGDEIGVEILSVER